MLHTVPLSPQFSPRFPCTSCGKPVPKYRGFRTPFVVIRRSYSFRRPLVCQVFRLSTARSAPCSCLNGALELGVADLAPVTFRSSQEKMQHGCLKRLHQRGYQSGSTMVSRSGYRKRGLVSGSGRFRRRTRKVLREAPYGSVSNFLLGRSPRQRAACHPRGGLSPNC